MSILQFKVVAYSAMDDKEPYTLGRYDTKESAANSCAEWNHIWKDVSFYAVVKPVVFS